MAWILTSEVAIAARTWVVSTKLVAGCSKCDVALVFLDRRSEYEVTLEPAYIR